MIPRPGKNTGKESKCFHIYSMNIVVKSFKKRLVNQFQEHNKMVFGHNPFDLFSEISKNGLT